MVIEGIKRIDDLCALAETELGGGAARTQLAEIRRGIMGPIRVAVAGREKAGKSTLVNALLGQKVAQTATGTCTRLVTVYHFGFPERIEAHFTNGEVRQFPWIPDQWPNDKDLSTESGRECLLHIYLSNSRLRNASIVDTPGLESLQYDYSSRTSSLMASAAGSDVYGEIDALVYLFQQPRSDDMSRLEAFVRRSTGHGLTALNAVGVLSRIDSLAAAGDDPWPAATRIAEKYTRAYRPILGSVFPIIGLLAETSTTGALTEADGRALRSLAAQSDRVKQLATISVQRFIDSDICLTPDVRSGLLSKLGLYGIRAAMEILGDGNVELSGLVPHLLRQSRVDDLDAHIRTHFQGQAEVFKVASACRVLRRLAFTYRPSTDPKFMSVFQDEVRAIEISREMHRLAEIQALGALPEADQIDPAMREEAVALFLLKGWNQGDAQDSAAAVDASTPDEDNLRARLQSWQRLENDPASDYTTRTICRVVRLSYMQILGDMSAQT